MHLGQLLLDQLKKINRRVEEIKFYHICGGKKKLKVKDQSLY
jgi:hypothetical protein